MNTRADVLAFGHADVWCATAPMRVDVTGGYTDIEPIVSRFDEVKVVNTAIDRQVHVRGARSLTPGSTVTLVDARGISIRAESSPASELARRSDIVGLVARILLAVGIEADLDISIDLPLGCGAGTSGAVTVAVTTCVLAVAGRSDVPISSLPHFAGTMERIAGHAGGLQDQLAASIGGLNCHRFMRNDIGCLDLRWASYLFDGMYLAIPPDTRNGVGLVELVLTAVAQGDSAVNDALRQLVHLGSEFFEKMARRTLDVVEFGGLVLAVLEQQRRLHPEIDYGITRSPFWSYICDERCVAKPIGGAGIGSAWLILPPADEDMIEVVRHAGWKVSAVAVQPHGISLWRER